MSHLAQNLKLIRLVADLTQPEFGKKFGATKAMVISYEKELANPDGLFLQRVSDFAGIKVQAITDKVLKESDLNIKVEKEEKDEDLDVPAPSTKAIDYNELTMYHLAKSNEKNADANLILTRLLELAMTKGTTTTGGDPAYIDVIWQTTFQALREFVIEKVAEVQHDTPESVGAQLGKKQADVIKRVKQKGTPLG